MNHKDLIKEHVSCSAIDEMVPSRTDDTINEESLQVGATEAPTPLGGTATTPLGGPEQSLLLPNQDLDESPMLMKRPPGLRVERTLRPAILQITRTTIKSQEKA